MKKKKFLRWHFRRCAVSARVRGDGCKGKPDKTTAGSLSKTDKFQMYGRVSENKFYLKHSMWHGIWVEDYNVKSSSGTS